MTQNCKIVQNIEAACGGSIYAREIGLAWWTVMGSVVWRQRKW